MRLLPRIPNPTSNSQGGTYSAPKRRGAQSFSANEFDVLVSWLPKGIRGPVILIPGQTGLKWEEETDKVSGVCGCVSFGLVS